MFALHVYTLVISTGRGSSCSSNSSSSCTSISTMTRLVAGLVVVLMVLVVLIVLTVLLLVVVVWGIPEIGLFLPTLWGRDEPCGTPTSWYGTSADIVLIYRYHHS